MRCFELKQTGFPALSDGYLLSIYDLLLELCLFSRKDVQFELVLNTLRKKMIEKHK